MHKIYTDTVEDLEKIKKILLESHYQFYIYTMQHCNNWTPLSHIGSRGLRRFTTEKGAKVKQIIQVKVIGWQAI